MRQLPGFAGSTGQGGVLTARDLLFSDSFADAYQLGVDPSPNPVLNAAYMSVSSPPCSMLRIQGHLKALC